MADRTIKPDDTNDLVLSNNHGDAKIEVNEDDTIVVTSGGDVTIDATGDIILDAGGADVTLKDGGTTYGSLKQASGHLVIQPESSKEIILNDQGGTAALTVDTSSQNVSINNGNLVIGSAGGGIDLSACTGNAGAEILDDYEEGSGTPSISMGGSGSVTMGSSNGYYYTKIGDLVSFSFEFQTIGVSSPVGALRVSLPFTGKTLHYAAGSVRVYAESFTGDPFLALYTGGTYVYFQTNVSASPVGDITPTAGTRYYFGTITYKTV